MLENFGKNVQFTPDLLLTPSDTNAVLACLERYQQKKIRAVGSLHSWSDSVVCHGVILDLRRMDKVSLLSNEDGTVDAEIEAGCTIGRALEYLRAHGGFTLPTIGMIKTQTIAGAIATATHGSGRSSLSHYVKAISVAAYDAKSGEARVYRWSEGPALEAARCGLGYAGIVLSVRIPLEAEYLIEEQTQWFERIEEVLEQERRFPRQQFYLIPWSWRWLAQLRRVLPYDDKHRPGLAARANRLFRFIGVDVMMNGIARWLSGSLRSASATRWHLRRLFPMIARPGVRVTDYSSHTLTMRHDLYVHVEMELFVPAEHVVHAVSYVEWVLRCCGGESLSLPAMLSGDTFGRDLLSEIKGLSGRYVHDHPITCRRVLRDDAMIAMTSGESTDAWYAISLVTYKRDRGPFLEVARFMAVTMAAAYGARPHWGKIFPLEHGQIESLYPNLGRFRAHCASIDPHQVFVNDFGYRVLGFSQSSRSDDVSPRHTTAT